MKRRRTVLDLLAPGSETCPICMQRYVLEMEYRCSGCDRGVCEQCAILVHERSEVFCNDCPPAEEEPFSPIPPPAIG